MRTDSPLVNAALRSGIQVHHYLGYPFYRGMAVFKLGHKTFKATGSGPHLFFRELPAGEVALAEKRIVDKMGVDD